MDDLSSLIDFTAEVSPANAINYPQLASLDGEDEFAFMLSHSLRHTDKSTGRLQTLLEAYEHGNMSALKRDVIEREAVKFVFNAFRIVQLLGMSSADVAVSMREQFKPRT